jgi:uncharacterized protein (TIGR02246 family)
MHNLSPVRTAPGLTAGAFRLALVFLALLVGAQTARAADPEEGVRAVIEGLQTSWNAGDMDGYLDAYRRDASMSLTFGNTVVQGWQALNTMFRSHYPDRARMGTFTIDSLAVTLLGPDAAIAYGNFTHVFTEETIAGGYSHVLTRDDDGRWLIQHERTSRGEVTPTP